MLKVAGYTQLSTVEQLPATLDQHIVPITSGGQAGGRGSLGGGRVCDHHPQSVLLLALLVLPLALHLLLAVTLLLALLLQSWSQYQRCFKDYKQISTIFGVKVYKQGLLAGAFSSNIVDISRNL